MLLGKKWKLKSILTQKTFTFLQTFWCLFCLSKTLKKYWLTNFAERETSTSTFMGSWWLWNP
jgi:hypothetical protein